MDGPTEPRGLLIVDDEKNILTALYRQLVSSEFGEHCIYTAQSGEEGLELLQSKKAQVIITDQRMPSMTGTDFLSQVKKLYPHTIRMILSGYSDFYAVQEAINRGEVYRFLNKPWNSATLLRHIRDAYRQYDFQMQNFYAHQAMTQALEAVMITDSNFIIISVNTTFCLETEYSQEEAIGSFIDLIDRESITSEELAEIYEHILNQGIWQGRLMFKKKSGEKFPVFLSISAIYDEMGTIMRYVYLFF